MSDIESKSKESENRRATLVFEYEKDRAKWQLERDHIINQKAEMQEHIDRLERRKDALLRENEKLKSDNKTSKKFLFSNQSNTIGGASTGSSSQSRYNMMTKSSVTGS